MGGFSSNCVFNIVINSPTNMKNEFSQLVSKVLAGEASDNEKKSLQKMLFKSSEDTLLYNQLKEYWDADVNLKNMNKENFEKSLMAQLDFESQVQPSKYKKLYFRIASAAAVIFFVMTCSLAYLYTSTANEFYTFSAQSTPIEYTLQDGTKVTLNKNSSLTYKSDFGEKRRDVKLSGEAYFKVTKDKTRPFIVEALKTKTEVLGTSFNVRANKESGKVITTLVEGSVRFMAVNCQQVLKPGEEIAFNTKTQKFEVQKIDTQYNTSWVSGRYIYNNVTFADLANKLENIYKLKIEISDSKIANHIVSASFLNEEPVEEILKSLENELLFNYVIKDSTQINIISKTLKN
jgi:ferric-dicitrate binding protein FerR (iron transport regulator)